MHSRLTPTLIIIETSCGTPGRVVAWKTPPKPSLSGTWRSTTVTASTLCLLNLLYELRSQKAPPPTTLSLRP